MDSHTLVVPLRRRASSFPMIDLREVASLSP